MEQRTYPDLGRRKIRLFSVRAAVLALLCLCLSSALFAGGVTAGIDKVRRASVNADEVFADENMKNAEKADISHVLRKSTAEQVIENESIPDLSYDQICAMDVSVPSGVTVNDLRLVTRGSLRGLEEAFYRAEHDHDVNCLFVMAIASHESADGTMCFRPNNMFGFGSSGFSSKEECIDTVAGALAEDYLSPGGSLYSGSTISAVNSRYAADPQWSAKVARRMAGYYGTISASHNAQLEKLR